MQPNDNAKGQAEALALLMDRAINDVFFACEHLQRKFDREEENSEKFRQIR